MLTSCRTIQEPLFYWHLFLHSQGEEDSGAGGPGWEEVLTWLVEVGAEGESDAEGSEGESGRGTARLSWSTKLSAGASTTATTEEPPHEHRVNTRLDIEKDDIQAVLPISKVRISLIIILRNKGNDIDKNYGLQYQL